MALTLRDRSKPSNIATNMNTDTSAIDSSVAATVQLNSKDERHLFTSESVGEGHPDKVADQISDAVLDAYISEDPESHVGCETFITSGLVVVGGEVRSTARPDIGEIARSVVRDIGYNNPAFGTDHRSMAVVNVINPQSSDIEGGIQAGYEQSQSSIGAGDQGIMFGYACNESEELMPIALMLAHKMMRRAARVRKEEGVRWLGPDCKGQVTIEYKNNTPQRIDTIVLSHQHTEEVSEEQVRRFLTEKVIAPILAETPLESRSHTALINPSGRFVIGGPRADAGLTGRKIISDTYGGAARHGGGAFSGKDPSKVDRSAAYMARKVAKNIVAAELATHCELQLSYAIGIPEPISITLYTFGTERVEVGKIERAVRALFRFSPSNIIDELMLKRPIYRDTAIYGHFGQESFPWEACDKVERLQAEIV